MKHYPIVVAGEKAAACVETGWEWAVVSLKFSHRKGQKVNFTYCESDLVSNIWIDEYPNYTAIRFQTKQQYWEGAREVVLKSIEECIDRNISDWARIKASIKEALSNYIWTKTKRNPMILPIITEV